MKKIHIKENVFSRKKAVIIFQETEVPNKFLTFKGTKPFYISGNGNPKKLLIFQEVTFRAQMMKKTTLKMFLIFREMDLSSSGIKKLLTFQ